jgi:predicted dehydrogenase
VSTVFAGPGAGDLAAFQPGAGMALSYDDLKVVEAHHFLRAIAGGGPSGAVVADALSAALALDALAASAADGRWVDVLSGDRAAQA